MTELSPPPHSSESRLRTVWILKRILFLLVFGLVAWHIVHLWGRIEWSATQLRPTWLFAAVVSYLLGWLPCIWYWRTLLLQQGTKLPWTLLIRAHYCGQLGKYVPGKAAALLIRAEMIRPGGVPLLTGLLTAGFESLATMAVGAAVAASLAPFALRPEDWLRLHLPWMTNPFLQGFIVIAGIAIAIISIPLFSHLLNLVLHRIVRKVVKEETSLPEMRPSTWAFPALVLTWWLHGLSLGCTIQGVGADVDLLGNMARWTATASLGTVLGFVVLFAPGGAGVREGVMLTLLQGTLGPQAALIVILLRLLWLAGELSLACVLFLLLRPAPSPAIPRVKT